MRADCFIYGWNKGTTYIPMVADIQRDSPLPFHCTIFCLREYSVFMNLAELVRLDISGIDREANIRFVTIDDGYEWITLPINDK